MDYVMRTFINTCEKQKIKFTKAKYTIQRAATTSSNSVLGTYGSKTISWVGYADDIVLVFEDALSMQNGLLALNETFNRFGLKINCTKTKSMIFNFDGPDSYYPQTICSLEGNVIDYLNASNNYNDPHTGDSKINQKIGYAKCKFYEHAKMLMNYCINLTRE